MQRLLPLSIALVAADTPSTDDPCPTVPPFGYALEVGNAKGRNEAEAITAARSRAKEALATEVCSGVSELRCMSIRKNIRPWGDGRFDRKAQSACAAVAVKRELVDSFERDTTQLTADIAALVPAISRATAGEAVQIEPPAWASGCNAGDIGASLVGALRTALAASPGVRLVRAGASDSNAAHLRLTLAPGRDTVQVDAGFHRPRQTTETPIGGFTFPIDLFALSSEEVGQCRTDSALGFSGERLGADGLQVRVEIPTADGRICEGQSFQPIVHTSASAWVQVWSVAKDGTAYLVFPPPGTSTPTVGALDLGPTQAVRLAGYPGDESLVAVANATALGGRVGLCRLEQPFHASAIAPDSAALARTTYEVIPAGTEGCPAWSGAARAPLELALAQAPACR